MNCPKCGVTNDAANTVCVACGASLAAQPSLPTVGVSTRQFRDPKSLTQWLRWLLIGLVVVYAASGVAEIFQLQLLHAMRDGSFPSEADMMSAAQANDTRQTAIGTAYLILFICTVVLFAVWIYRADSNIHALGARNLRFTPGWAVGWNFVPIANLWKPYQAMSEIWRASKNPSGWQSESPDDLLGWWWFWWIASTLFDNLTRHVAEKVDGLDEMISLAPMIIGSCLLDAVAAVFALLVVTRIQGLQAQAADRPLSSAFA